MFNEQAELIKEFSHTAQAGKAFSSIIKRGKVFEVLTQINACRPDVFEFPTFELADACFKGFARAIID